MHQPTLAMQINAARWAVAGISRILAVSAPLASSLFAQPCDPPPYSFVLNRDTVCVGQEVVTINTGSASGQMTWNFCDGAVLNGTFQRTTILSTTASTTAFSIVEENGVFWGFYVQGNRLRRVGFGDSPLNPPGEPVIFNVIDFSAYSIAPYVQNGNCYLFVTRGIVAPTELYRINFGSSFSNNSPSLTTVSTGTSLAFGFQMRFVDDVDGNVKLLIANGAGNNHLAVVNFGADVTNTTPEVWVRPMPYALAGLDVAKTCAGWQVVVGQGSRLTIFNFGDVINPTVQEPVIVGEINSPPGLTLNIRSLKLFAEAGRWYVWLESQGQANFRSVVLGFNQSQISLPFTHAASYPGPPDGYSNGMDMRRWNGRNIFWTSDNNGANSAIFRMEFLPACDHSEVFDTPNNEYVYLRPGNRIVGGYMLMDNGATILAAQEIAVSGAVPDFSVGPACIGLATVFANQTQAFAPGATFWRWDFGDQTFSDERDPVHTYDELGQYVVTLSAYSPAGCVDEVSRIVTAVSRPMASFSFQSTGGCMTDPFAFTDLSTGDPPVSFWQWDMGDGTTYFSPNVEHRYTTGGSYTVRLIVENEGGCRDTATQTLAVPGFDFSVSNACIGNVATLSVSSFYPSNVAVVGYTWEIFTSPPALYFTENPTHVFTEGGSFNVKLTLRTNSGCTDTVRKTIFVTPPPAVEFSTLNNPISGTPIYFLNQSQFFGATVVSWRWDFGAPGAADTASSFNAQYTYSGPGTYLVTLTMETAAGCRDTFTQTIVVCDPDFCNLPSFSLPDTICSQHNLVFTGTGGECVRDVRWNYCTVALDEPMDPVEYSNVLLNDSRGIKIVKFGDSWHGFAVVRGVGVQRLDFGASLFNEPSVVNLAGLPSVGMPLGPEIVFHRGRWYGFVFYSNFNNGVTLYRLDFGDSLTNPTPTVVNLGHLGLTSGGDPIAAFIMAQEADGQFIGIVATYLGSKIVMYDFGYSPENIPAYIHEFTIPGQIPIYLTAERTCSGWIILSVNFGGSMRASVARFGNRLSDPVVSTANLNISRQASGRGFFPYYENGNWFLFYQSYNSRAIERVNIGPDLYNPAPQTPIQTWPTGSAMEGLGFGAVRDDNGNLHFFSVSNGISALRRLTFPARCDNIEEIYRSTDSLTLRFSLPGNYPIDRCVTYANGRTACYTAQINVVGTSVAFDFDNPCAGKPVQFTDQSLLSTPGALYQWDFGDQTEGSTLFNPAHVFDLPGTYPVTLTVSDPAGCVNTLTRNVQVKPTPNADFYITPLGGCVGSPIRFSDNSTFADGDIVLRAWDMGDNIQIFDSTEFNYSYARGGTYRVRLTAYGNNLCSDSQELFIAAPGAYFETTSACAGLATRFSGKATYYGDAVSAWKWNFGDPGSGTANFAFQQNPSHVYAQPGIYDVELVVETVNGCSDTVREKIGVGSLPMADFAVRSAVCAGDAVSFEDRSTANVAPVVAYRWDFGVPNTDDDTAVVAKPRFVYSEPGEYTVRLTITTTSGCQATLSRTITVAPPAVARILTDTLQCAGLPFVFESEGNLGAKLWEFGANGYFSTLDSPAWKYDSVGTYDVRLTVTTEAGCVETHAVRMHVLPSPTLSVVTSETVGREPFQVDFFVQADAALGFRLNDTLFTPKLDTTEAGLRFSVTFSASGRDTVVQRLEVFAGEDPCRARLLVPITVYPPLDSVWDIAVENFAPRVGTDGYLSVISRFRNKGNVPIYYFDAAIQYGGLTVARQWMNEDTLMPGDALERFFNIRLLTHPFSPEKFACVEAALPNGRPDSRPEDNLFCKALEESLSVVKVYPNPTRDRLFVAFVSPVAETVPLDVYDFAGRKILTLPYPASAGLNEAEFDLSNLADGMYVLMFTFRNQREHVKFAVSR